MNNKQQAIDGIVDFLKSDEKSILITGTNQFEKHKLVMRILNKYYKNKHILFRINGMDNITNDAFIGLNKKLTAGTDIKIGNNIYQFDSFNIQTWRNSMNEFDFAIIYPIDYLCREAKKEVFENLFKTKTISKIFLCSWTDSLENDYTKFSEYYSRHIIYDAEEEDIDYHNRVIKNITEIRY